MKQDHDEKLDSLTSQLRKLKEDNATAKAEIECYKNQINRNGESFDSQLACLRKITEFSEMVVGCLTESGRSLEIPLGGQTD